MPCQHLLLVIWQAFGKDMHTLYNSASGQILKKQTIETWQEFLFEYDKHLQIKTYQASFN